MIVIYSRMLALDQRYLAFDGKLNLGSFSDLQGILLSTNIGLTLVFCVSICLSAVHLSPHPFYVLKSGLLISLCLNICSKLVSSLNSIPLCPLTHAPRKRTMALMICSHSKLMYSQLDKKYGLQVGTPHY